MKIKRRFQDYLGTLVVLLDKAEVERDWDVVKDVRVEMEERITEIDKEIQDYLEFFRKRGII